jgi:hypothetical protein
VCARVGHWGAAALPPGPVGGIARVQLLDGALEGSSELSGTLELTVRTNQAQAAATTVPSSYYVQVRNPDCAQSDQAQALVFVQGYDPRASRAGTLVPDADVDGDGDLYDAGSLWQASDAGRHLITQTPRNLSNAAVFEIVEFVAATHVRVSRRSTPLVPGPLVYETPVRWAMDPASDLGAAEVAVEYRTLSQYETLRDRFTRSQDRNLVVYPLVRAFYPVTLAMHLRVEMARLAARSLDTYAARVAVGEIVAAHPQGEELNVDDITAALRARFPEIGTVLRHDPALEVVYTIAGPDGRQATCRSAGEIAVDPQYGASAADRELLTWMVSRGVSARTCLLEAPVETVTVEVLA